MIKVASLFCGCGGADLGLTGGFSYLGKKYPKNPVKIIHASDIDKKAIATYNENFKHNAETVDVRELAFEKGAADLLIGGFPCQSFSSVNPNKNPEDDRSQLFYQMARILGEIKPKAFIAENVKGFYVLHGQRYFQRAKLAFEEEGYEISHKILKATDFGVPQKRERLFIVGIRRDVNQTFQFPEPSHGSHQGALKQPVLRDVIDSLIPENPKYYFSERAVQGVKNAKNNMKRALAQSLDDQCLTISSHLAKVSLNSRDPVLLVDPEKELYRRFSPLEAARIQSFPDNFKFVGSEADAYRQIGNAIPPILMWSVVNAVLKQVFLSDKIDI
jgi:DNA (cytosine-5)-methyltransferase 1